MTRTKMVREVITRCKTQWECIILHLCLLLNILTLIKRYVEKRVILWEFAAGEGKGEKKKQSMEKKGLVIIRVGRKKRGKKEDM